MYKPMYDIIGDALLEAFQPTALSFEGSLVSPDNRFSNQKSPYIDTLALLCFNAAYLRTTNLCNADVLELWVYFYNEFTNL